jgi:crotonobetainyl-CoA:carnitine CoA-transferase CaiB-like acyl-CoA transferase
MPDVDALAGLRVLDLSSFLAAPQVSAMLGDFGADVIKVEPPGGDAMRSMGVRRNGYSLMWALVSRNKRSVVVDTDTDDGISQLHQLTTVADVVVINQPRGLLERWGVTPEEIAGRNPRAVVVSISCFGETGPRAGSPGAGTLAEAFGGLTGLTGEPDGPPVLPSFPLGDTLAAMAGVIGTLLACYHRDARGGSGQYVDVSMYEPILTLIGPSIAGWAPGTPSPARTGSRVDGGVPRNVYRSGDGLWMVLSGTTDAQVARILRVIGHDTPEDHARFRRSADRLAAADELDGMVAEWIGCHDRHRVLSVFEEARIPVAPVNDLAALAADAQVRARGSLTELYDDNLGTVVLPSPAARLGATPGRPRTTGPRLGQHTAEVLAEWLGDRHRSRSADG